MQTQPCQHTHCVNYPSVHSPGSCLVEEQLPDIEMPHETCPRCIVMYGDVGEMIIIIYIQFRFTGRSKYAG